MEQKFQSFPRRLALLAGSVIFFLVLAELCLRGYGFVRQSYLVEMWRYGRNHKQFTGDARSHVHIPRSESRVMGQPVKIDARGYRADAEREPDPLRRRVLALGDSITFGFGVRSEEAYPARLEKLVPGSQFWNAGIGNYNTAQEFASLPEHLANVKPAEVLLGFFINDLEPTQKGSEATFLQGSLLFGIATQVWWSYASADRRDFLEYYARWATEGWPQWEKAANEGIALLEKEKIPLRVLLIPELHTLGKPGLKPEYAKVRSFFEAQGVKVCEGEKFFPAVTDGGRAFWAARDDSHPNAEAHAILAAAAAACFYGAK